MKKLRVMDSTGDTVIEFDPAQAEAQATKDAQALFERLTGKGAAVFAVNRDGPDKRVRDFNELEAENVIVPVIVGG